MAIKRLLRIIMAVIACLPLHAISQATFRSSAQAGATSGTTASPITIAAGARAERTNCGDITPGITAGAVGDLLIAQVVAKQTNATVTMSGWNTLYSDTASATNYKVFLFWRSATSAAANGDPRTINQAGTCNLVMATITRYGNVDTTQPLETFSGGGAFSNAGNMDTGTQAINVVNSILVLAGFVGDNLTITQDASFTQLYDVADGSGTDATISLNYRYDTTTGTKGPFLDMDLSGNITAPNTGVLFAVRPVPTTNTLTINVPAGTVSGDLMLASIAVRPNTVGIAAPSGWTQIQQTMGTSQSLTSYYRLAGASEPASYTWTFLVSHTGAVGGILSFSGADPTTPINVSAGQATASNTTHIAPTVTTTELGILVTVHEFASAVAWSPPGGMTEAVDVPSQTPANAVGISMEMNYESLATTGATGTRTATAASDADAGATQSIGIAAPPSRFAIASNNWNNTATWSSSSCSGAPGASVPAAGSTVVICATRTVTLNTNTANLAGLSIQSTGVLNIGNDGTARTLTVSGDVSNAGTLRFNTAAAHVATIGGSLTNSGTLTSAAVAGAKTLTVTGTITNSGTFRFAGTAAMTVNANAGIVNSNIFDVDTASNLSHVLNIATDINNTGTFNLAPDTDSLANTTFTGGITHTITGSSAMQFNNTTVNNNLTVNKSAGAITQSGTFTVNGNLTVQAGTLNLANAASVTGNTSISGALSHTTATGARSFTGAVTINNGGAWNNTANRDITMGDSLTNDGTFTSGTGTYTFQTTSGAVWAGINGLSFGGAVTVNANRSNNTTTSIAGVLAIASGVTITNNSTATVSGNIVGGAASATWTNAANSTLNAAADLLTTGTLNASANNNTVHYNGTVANVAVKLPSSNNYYHLTISNTGTKTPAAGTYNIGGNLTINTGSPFNVTTNDPALNVTGNTTIDGTYTGSDTAALTMVGNLTIGGTYTGNGGAANLAGNFTNNGSFTSGAGAFTFNGTAAQTLTGTNGGTTSFNNLTLNNANGLTLTGTHNATVSTLLTLTSGRITTGSNILFISNGSNISGAGASTFVVGNLRKAYPAGDQTRSFEVGTVTGSVLYAPVTIRFGNVTGAGNFTVTTTASDHPQIATSTVDATASINRYWTLTNNSVTFAANANNSATYTYNNAADYDAGADFNQFYVGRYDGSTWTEFTPSARTATSVTISGTGLTTATFPGDHQIGTRIPTTVTCNTVISPGIPGSYFNNMTLAGSATGTRTDGPIDFNWAAGTPGVTGIGADQFSVRWSGILRATVTGNYQFQTVSDDGVRLWVGNTLVINNWTDHASTTNTSGVVALTAGTLYFIRLEFYENGGQAEIRLRWQPPSSSFTAIPIGPEPTLGAGLYSCAAQTTGLSAHYTMDQVSWNGTSNEVTDISGNLRHGTSTGGTTTGAASAAITGSPGTCRYGVFDGSDDYVSVTNLSSILNGTASLAFWIKTSQTGDNLAWQAPGVTGVEQSGGADDIFWGWLDATGHIGVSVGNTFTTKSTVAINNGNWHHIVLTRDHTAGAYKIYIDGGLDSSGVIATGLIGTPFSSIGRIDDTGGTPMYLNGQLDEVRIYNYVLSNAEVSALVNQTRACASFFDHVQIEHGSGSSLSCNPATLTVKACEDSTCSSFYTGGVTGTLTVTGTPTVNWTGTAAFTIASGSSSVTKTFQVSTAGSILLGTTGVSPAPSGTSPTCNFGTPSCTFTTADTGFIFNVPDHIADTTQNVTVSAVRTDDTTQKCVPAFQSTAKTVNFWSGYLNPASGTQSIAVNGSNIATSSPGTGLNLNFDANGEVSVTVRYPDVGQMRLNAQHTGSGLAAGLIMSGQDNFITRPDHFTLTIAGNPAAADASGNPFVHAGENFNITVESRNASNAITPNYGKESTPETVGLTKTLVAPSGGNNPALTGNFGNFALDCNGSAATAGTACGTFSWPEVGIIELTPHVGDNNYLGSGNVTGTTSGNIGRFIPNSFTLTNGALATRIASGCLPNSTFTYMGENLELGFRLTAKATDGTTTTQNYTGAFAKLDPTSAAALHLGAINTTGPNLLSGRISAGTITGTWNNGVVDITAPVTITRAATPDGPYQALAFGAAPLDTDSVALDPATRDLDTDNNASNESRRINATNTDVRYGRLFMENAFGSELLPLTIPLYAEYYSGTQFTLNTNDSCTAYDASAVPVLPLLPFANRTGLTADPARSGVGRLINGRYDPANPVQLDSADQTGSIDMNLVAPSYLLYDWTTDGSLDGVEDDIPFSKATFGIYGGTEDNQIYIREVY